MICTQFARRTDPYLITGERSKQTLTQTPPLHQSQIQILNRLINLSRILIPTVTQLTPAFLNSNRIALSILTFVDGICRIIPNLYRELPGSKNGVVKCVVK
jgi:hypothetical protein